jgi:hypothetical protein
VRTTSPTATLLLATYACVASACGSRSRPPETSPLQAAILRREQAPIVGLRDVLDSDTLLGHRLRVTGWCAVAPGLLGGRRVGLWLLAAQDTTIEVRGLVPPECAPELKDEVLLMIFAQVVPASSKGGGRLLLRLPD